MEIPYPGLMVQNVKFMKQPHTCNNCITIYILNLCEYAVMQKKQLVLQLCKNQAKYVVNKQLNSQICSYAETQLY